MANERLAALQNFIAGSTTDNPLASGATTLNSANLANLAAVGGYDYATLVLDPAAVNGAPEVIHVTAHTASATAATIVRAREGSTARSHPAGTVWVLALTAGMVPPKSIDLPWAGDTLAGGPFDQEFNRDALVGTPPSGWVWVNQGTSYYYEEFGAGLVVPQVTNGATFHSGLGRAVPAAAAWVATAKVTSAQTNSGNASSGLFLRDTVGAKAIQFEAAGDGKVYLARLTSMTAFSAAIQSPNFVPFNLQYFRIRKNSATSWDFQVSNDGIVWLAVQLAYDVSAFFTPDQIGFCAQNATNIASGAGAACHWFRIR